MLFYTGAAPLRLCSAKLRNQLTFRRQCMLHHLQRLLCPPAAREDDTRRAFSPANLNLRLPLNGAPPGTLLELLTHSQGEQLRVP